MTVLVPVDGSDVSMRALEFAIDFADRFETDLHCLHVTDVETEDTKELVERIQATLADTPFASDPEVVTDKRRFRANDEVGRIVAELVEEEGYDYVVMGHHPTGTIGKALLGSASETAIDRLDVPVTIVP